MEHVNFYENIAEALIRLKQTIVLYYGYPNYVHTIAKYGTDEILRVYMTPLEKMQDMPQADLPSNGMVPHGHDSMAKYMDQWMEQHPNWIVRKMMNSPKFNRFRPFPIGMVNQGTRAVYCARQPARPKTEQGLIPSMLLNTPITVNPAPRLSAGLSHHVDCYNKSFKDAIVGDYPSPKVTLEGLKNPNHSNESVAFNREFALVKGPIDLMFLAYRDEIIGVLPNGDFSSVRLGKEHKHCKEVTDELNLFYNIEVQQ